MRSSGGEPTVFVVEDDEAVRNALLFLFSSAGLTVQAFASAEDFLAAQPAADSGCLILDIRLPDMSGLDLIDQMPEGVAALPVICVTGEPSERLRARARKAGAVAFLRKPLAEDQLLHLVREVIQQSQDGDSSNLQGT